MGQNGPFTLPGEAAFRFRNSVKYLKSLSDTFLTSFSRLELKNYCQ